MITLESERVPANNRIDYQRNILIKVFDTGGSEKEDEEDIYTIRISLSLQTTSMHAPKLEPKRKQESMSDLSKMQNQIGQQT